MTKPNYDIEFVVMKELKDLIPSLSSEEFKQLKDNCVREGVRDPLVIAKYPDNETGEELFALADGHNRYEIATKFNLDFNTYEKQFNSYDDVKLWMIDNQNGRRNLADWVRFELIQIKKEILLEKGKRKLIESGAEGGRGNLKGLSIIDKPFIETHNTQKELATDLGWSTGKVAMADKVKKHIDETENKELATKLRTNEISINQAYQALKPKAHVSNNSGNNEWYTPQQYIESARLVMGSIDLDPASSAMANQSVKATKYYSEKDNGLTKEWYGNIWMNPPYSQPLIGDFITKLSNSNYNQAIVLVNNATETKWGNLLLSISSAVCFHKGRIRFVYPGGKLGDSPLQGQVICYIGKNQTYFINEFSKYGLCLQGVK